MTTFRISTVGSQVTKYPDLKAAQNDGNGGTLVSSEAELAKSGVLMSAMLRLHNRANPDRTVTKFTDRDQAAQRLFPLLEKLSEPAPVASAPKETEVPTTTKAKTTKTAKTTKAKGNAGNLTPRTSAFAGKKISLGKATKGENIRKVGTGGHKSMEIVRKNPGITFEDFKAKGGRAEDLRWDLEKGNYELK